METDKHKALDELEKVAQEIDRKFEQWDEHIKAHMQPVPIQDLDYWRVQIYKALRVLDSSRLRK